MADLDLVVEFLNTIDKRTFRRHGEPHVAGEHLTSPQALADWLATAHLPASPGSHLDPRDLAASIALRTALRAALNGGSGALGGDPMALDHDSGTLGGDPRAIDGGSGALIDYPVRLVPGPPGDGLRLAADTGRPWLDEIVEAVAASVARGDWKRVKLCDAPDCRWAFHDTSRNGRGRWCEMGVCGNRHKTRAYRERRQQHPA